MSDQAGSILLMLSPIWTCFYRFYFTIRLSKSSK